MARKPLIIEARLNELGGHVSPGIGDYAWPELGRPDNTVVVAHIPGLARAMGREVATVAQTRELLGL